MKSDKLLDSIDADLHELQKLRADLEAAKKEITEWENREASCCPEDVPFEDMIKKLRADLEAAKAENTQRRCKFNSINAYIKVIESALQRQSFAEKSDKQ